MKVAVLVGDSPEPPDAVPTEYTADFQKAVFDALREASGRFAAGVPGARLTTVPNATHYAQTQRPDVVIDAIRGVMS
jgi:pimeloyl-ACP methyl ester carboxylesterase